MLQVMQRCLHDSSSASYTRQLVTSERGVCGGPLAFHYANLCHKLHSVSHWPVLVYFINQVQSSQHGAVTSH
jgi:hypothetical protein